MKETAGLVQSSRSATFKRRYFSNTQVGWYGNTQVGWYGSTQLVDTQDHLEVVEMEDRFWKSMPAALKRPTLEELYRRLRDLDYTQMDERMAVMLNAILQLEAQGECRESATEAVFMVGYTTDGISNQEQTRWLS